MQITLLRHWVWIRARLLTPLGYETVYTNGHKNSDLGFQTDCYHLTPISAERTKPDVWNENARTHISTLAPTDTCTHTPMDTRRCIPYGKPREMGDSKRNMIYSCILVYSCLCIMPIKIVSCVVKTLRACIKSLRAYIHLYARQTRLSW